MHKLQHEFCSALNPDDENNQLDLQTFVHNTCITLCLSATGVAYAVSLHHYKEDEDFPICTQKRNHNMDNICPATLVFFGTE